MIVLDEWLLTAERAAVYLPDATAVVADLHLGYGEARRRGGDAVPLAGVKEVLAPLLPLVRKHALRRLVIAGDLFEAGAHAELAEELLVWCDRTQVELAVVPGNHDRGMAKNAERLPIHPEGVALGCWRVVHGDETLPDGAIVQGHVHPSVRFSAEARWRAVFSGKPESSDITGVFMRRCGRR